MLADTIRIYQFQKESLELPIEKQEGHKADITSFIGESLVIHDPTLARIVQENVRDKAQGVFLWCTLVIGMLNEKHDQGQLNNQEEARSILDHLPGELLSLYQNILGLNEGDSARPDARTVTCLQWVLFAERQLNPMQTWHAIQLGEAMDGRPAHDYRQALPSQDDAIRFITHTSRGLVEVATMSNGRKQVQVVHESVRDYLNKKSGLVKLITLGLNMSETVADPEAYSFERLKRICLHEHFVHAAAIASEHHDASHFRAKCPLYIGAIKEGLRYAEAAAKAGHEQSDSLAFMRKRWVIPQRWPFGLHIKATLLMALITFDLPTLVRDHYRQLVKEEPITISRAFLHLTARHGGESGMTALWAWVEEHWQSQSSGIRRDGLEQVAGTIHWQNLQLNWRGSQMTWLFRLGLWSAALGTFFLIALVSDEHLDQMWEAAQADGLGQVLLFVLEKGVAPKVVLEDKIGPLEWAAAHGHVKLAELLLQDPDTSVNSTASGETALHRALERDQDEMTRFLL